MVSSTNIFTSKSLAFSRVKFDLTGFYIWKIEGFQLIPVQIESFGKFYVENAYIVISSGERDRVVCCDEKPRPPHGRLETHIHLWIGEEASQDEVGTAAIKIAELDELFMYASIQYREIQGNESKRFLAYFKNGLRYLKIGINVNLLKNSTTQFKPSLYCVIGSRNILVKEVQEISWQSMNEGDVYVLDCRKFIFVWIGRYSNYLEKLQGTKFATNLKHEYGKSQVIILEDEQENLLADEEKRIFEKLLPLKNKKLLPYTETEKFYVTKRKITSELKLFRCFYVQGTLKVAEVKNGPLLQSDLNSNESYIVDNYPEAIWIWIGRNTANKSREEALRNGQGFIAKKEYSLKTRLIRTIEGGESEDFKTLFEKWADRHQTASKRFRNNLQQYKTTVQSHFDTSTLHHKPILASITQLFDDGSGKKEIWRVGNFELLEVPGDEYGQFFSGDCYIILYKYTFNQRENYVIYNWIGHHCNSDEISTAALKTMEIDQKLQGKVVQVRITQGKEPPNFMKIFGSKIIVYQGKFCSALKVKRGCDRRNKSSYILQVTSTPDGFTKATEVGFKAANLNTNDCFVVVSSLKMFVWCGKATTGDERELAKAILADQGDPVLVSEGYEKEDFWQILGGQEKYNDSVIMKDVSCKRAARLFHCSNSDDTFTVEEIANFCQSDLIPSNIMVLDAWETLFIWIGSNANKQEVIEAETLALSYLKTDPAGRNEDTTVFKVKQGLEPPNFTGFFRSWDINIFSRSRMRSDISEVLREISPEATILVRSDGSNEDGLSIRKTYPLATLLVNDPEKLPKDVDPACKELYLCELDFKNLFRVDRSTFDAMPRWKQLMLKKNRGIF